jgi:hypothetical protein
MPTLFLSLFLTSAVDLVGMDVCSMIEKVKTDESDRPLDDIRIRSVDLE